MSVKFTIHGERSFRWGEDRNPSINTRSVLEDSKQKHKEGERVTLRLCELKRPAGKHARQSKDG